MGKKKKLRKLKRKLARFEQSRIYTPTLHIPSNPVDTRALWAEHVTDTAYGWLGGEGEDDWTHHGGYL